MIHTFENREERRVKRKATVLAWAWVLEREEPKSRVSVFQFHSKFEFSQVKSSSSSPHKHKIALLWVLAKNVISHPRRKARAKDTQHQHPQNHGSWGPWGAENCTKNKKESPTKELNTSLPRRKARTKKNQQTKILGSRTERSHIKRQKKVLQGAGGCQKNRYSSLSTGHLLLSLLAKFKLLKTRSCTSLHTRFLYFSLTLTQSLSVTTTLCRSVSFSF